MNFYQELQLNQAGSKSYIASFKNPKDKCKHIAVYLFKIALVVAFCVSFVTLFSVLFGNENSIAGVVVLLCVLAFRYSDLGIQNSQGTLGILSSMVFLHLVRSCLISLPPDCHSASISSAFSLWH